MRPLSDAVLLEVWERGQAQPPERRALMLLAAAWPGMTEEALAALPLGRRDALLFDLRARLFGPRLDSTTRCPACREQLEFSLSTDDVPAPPETPLPEVLTVRRGPYDVSFRLPGSRHVAEARAGDGGPLRLLEHCLVEASQGGEPVPAEALPAFVVTAITDRMAEADPLADLTLSLTCPACAHAWSAPFDIVTFFWAEIEAWAPRILQAVHVLARAYGWREADILALSARRRKTYLDMVM